MISLRLERPRRTTIAASMCIVYTYAQLFYVLFLCRERLVFLCHAAVCLQPYGWLYQLHETFQIVRLGAGILFQFLFDTINKHLILNRVY